ncbi:hypothetical protein V9K92_03265 [Phyllobacterium sp. CCNWLW109]|uniref:hypothetical protein n=1 Tax=Phyllobacterium sp. CCNWLW109 TaxID=3127479 RepID=UPI003077AB99
MSNRLITIKHTAVSLIGTSLIVAFNSIAFGENLPTDPLGYGNPCTDDASRKLREQLKTEVAEPEQLYDLIASMLCEFSISTEREDTVYRHIPPFITHTIEEIGELPSTSRVPRSQDLVSEMILASKVESAHQTIQRRSLVKVDYSSDICSRQVTTEFSRGSWLITNYISNCD